MVGSWHLLHSFGIGLCRSPSKPPAIVRTAVAAPCRRAAAGAQKRRSADACGPWC